MNKSRLLAPVLLLLLSAVRAGTETGPAPITILAFGDSLTAGKDLEDPDREAYPAALERKLRGKGYRVTVVNAGHSGDTTYDALHRLDYSYGGGADLVLVAFGANDTFQGKSLQAIEKNLDEIVRRLRAKRPAPHVLLCAMRTFPNLGPDYAGGFEAIYPRVAKRRGVALVPFFLAGVASVESMNLPDRVHPNARGQEKMAENLLPAVEAALKSRGGARGGRD